MFSLVKKILFKTLSLKLYLKCLHKFFFIALDLNLLKKDYIYKYHYFVKNLINEGDIVVDIGANLGYFSGIFLRLVGIKGHVYSFEPMPNYFEVLRWAFEKKNNITLQNVALGLENKTSKIFQPEAINNEFRTGLSNIEDTEQNKNGRNFEIQMRKGSELLAKVSKIHYIKIDIEGYEEVVLPEISEIIEKNKPIIQLETWGIHKLKAFETLKNLGYINYSLFKNQLIKNFDNDIEAGDYIFIHESKEEDFVSKFTDLGFLNFNE